MNKKIEKILCVICLLSGLVAVFLAFTGLLMESNKFEIIAIYIIVSDFILSITCGIIFGFNSKPFTE